MLRRFFLVTALILLLASGSAAAGTRFSAGSATTISKFNDLVYQHVSLAFSAPRNNSPWAPTAFVAGIGVFELDDDSAVIYTFGPAWRWHGTGSASWFVDAGIALAYLGEPGFREKSAGDVKDFGMHIEFMSHFSLGTYLDRAQRWSVKAGLMHVSNAGLDETNPGADFVGVDVEFAY